MKKLLSLLLLVVFFGINSSLVAASEEGTSQIVVVDIQRIMQESLAAKDMKKQIENKKQNFQKDIKKQEEDLQKQDRQLAEQRNVLSKEAFETKLQNFRKDVTEVQRKVQKKRGDLESAYSKALGVIQQEVLKIIGELAEEKGFAVALPNSQILYADSALDISNEVLSKLDEELPKVKIE